jgi:hypothetical protein
MQQQTPSLNEMIMRDAEAVGAKMDPNGFIMFTMQELELYTARAVFDAHDLIVCGGVDKLEDVLQQWGIDYEP